MKVLCWSDERNKKGLQKVDEYPNIERIELVNDHAHLYNYYGNKECYIVPTCRIFRVLSIG